MDDASRSQSRRHWLLRVLESTISISILVIAFPILWFLKPRKATQPTGALEVVAPYRVNQLVPDAQGKWPPPFDFGGKPCLLIKTPEGEIRAFNAVCTHTDCTVMFRPKKHDIFCNCHNGVYNLSGGNVSGPPPRPLEAYKVTLRGKPGQEEILVSRS